MKNKKFEIAQFVEAIIQDNLNTTIEQGNKIMNVLQEMGIVEARFDNGTYFKADKNNRSIVNKDIMLVETETDFMVRIPKMGHSYKEIINTNIPQPTQKMLGAYSGTSQSTVSKNKGD